jgi:hypothetical protein
MAGAPRARYRGAARAWLDHLGFAPMSEPTIDDVDALVGPATPHFAFQIRARVRELVAGLPEDHPVHRYATERLDELDRLGFASTLAADSESAEPRTRPGWEQIPSSAPASAPLPRNEP